MLRRRDPFARTPELIRRVYAYVAYRIGDGPDAEDVTSDVFERAIRYRRSYDDTRGEPLAWLLGIARRCIQDAIVRPAADHRSPPEIASSEDLEAATVERLTVGAAIATLDERGQDLIALRYGADLTARQIADVLGMQTNAVEVALHRALAKLQQELADERSPIVEVEARAADRPASASASTSRK